MIVRSRRAGGGEGRGLAARGARRIVGAAGLLLLGSYAALASGCAAERPPAVSAARLYFKPLLPPVGVSAAVVLDESLRAPAGGSIRVTVAVEADLDRDELQRLMDALFRQAASRRGFGAAGRAAARIDLRYYGSEAAARGGGDDWIGRTLREGLVGAPTVVNRQALPLLRLATEALGRQPQYTGVLRPELLADPQALSVEVTIPFVRDDGSGAAVERVSFELATTTLTATLEALFGKVPQLNQVTFVGRHRGRVVLRVQADRQQYGALGLLEVEEQLGALRGRLIGALGSGRLRESTAQGELALRRRERYREVLRRLPAGQVFIAPTLH
ncbi:MAG: hypothetical protein IPL40_09870 [Proteobacteria bacterium]|nr:hypothetical protein [Pseudomonadota bacterium]